MIGILRLHSIVDITTNSSSELFICKTEKTEEQIRNLFAKLDALLGFCNGFGRIYTTQGIDKFLDELERVEPYLQSSTLGIVYKLIPCDLLQQLNYSDVVKMHNYDCLSSITSFLVLNRAVLEPHFQNIVFIESEYENSIPGEYFAIINTIFKGSSIHIG